MSTLHPIMEQAMAPFRIPAAAPERQTQLPSITIPAAMSGAADELRGRTAGVAAALYRSTTDAKLEACCADLLKIAEAALALYARTTDLLVESRS